MRLLLAILLLIHSTSAFSKATPLTQSEALEDLHQLAAWIASDYGPLHMKQEKFGIDLEDLTHKYEERIRSTLYGEALPFELVKFAAEFKDSHFNVRLPISEEAGLGFTVDLIEGRALLDSIDRSLLPESTFPFALGDELVQFDGIGALEAAKNLTAYFGMGQGESSARLGVLQLTKRRGRTLPMPMGSAALGIRSFSRGKIEAASLPWLRKSNQIAPAMEMAGLSDMCNEKSQIQPPAGAEIVAGVPFTAFSYPSARGKVGFLHIPHYFPTNELGEEVAELRFRQYEEVIRKFEAETVGLVIDQNYNCGGSILFVNKLVSLFARESFRPASLRFRASQGQIDGLSRQLQKFRESDEGYARFQKVIAQISAAKEKNLFETAPIPLFDLMEVQLSLPGTETIAPNPIRYTKPIVLLINELSGSGGDLFPSLMQDIGRATLLGHRTMGAGGHLWDDPHLELPHSHAVVNLTRSLIVRLNGQLIENEGVHPDAPLELQRQDLLNGSQSYLREATNQLLRQL